MIAKSQNVALTETISGKVNNIYLNYRKQALATSDCIDGEGLQIIIKTKTQTMP